ncbi:MAG: Ig-like domain-containing protein [Bacteroidales bacterium]|nr:Ig-like domain-containing protein [Bacteroidales bacterium]
MRKICLSLTMLLMATTLLWAKPVPITGGTAEPADAEAGDQVTITAAAAPSGQRFAKWITTGVNVALPGAASTTFAVPDGDYKIEALYCDENLLAYDDFDAVMGTELNIPLEKADSKNSFGWSNYWQVQNGNTTVPGFNVSNISPLQFEGLFSTKNYARGGSAYLDALRVLDRRADGPFADYIAEGSDKIGSKAGSVLWFSALYRRDHKDANDIFRFFNGTNTGGTGSAILQIKLQDNKFAIVFNEGNPATVFPSDIEAVVGQTYLIVAKMEFGASNKISLFINPAVGTIPATPNAVGETSHANLPFACLAYYPNNNPEKASIDEIRFGKTYAAVTPATPTYDDAVTDITISTSTGENTVARGSKIAMTSVVAPATANPEILWSIEEGTGNAIIGATNGILTAVKNGTVKVVATSADGQFSKKFDLTITDTDFKPSITANSTNPAAIMQFTIAFNPNDTIKAFDASMIQLSGSSEPAIVKLSGNFPTYTASVMGMTKEGDLTLTIPEGTVKLKYDEAYGNKTATGSMQYKRYYPGTTGLTFAYFNGGDLKETLNMAKERFVINDANPFIAEVPFDETKPVFDNTTGTAAFKGGMQVDHTDGDKNQGVEQITNYSLPSLRSINEGSRYGSFSWDNSGNSDATTSAAQQGITTTFIWTKDQFVNGFESSKIALDNQSTFRLNVNEIMGNQKYTSIHFIIKNAGKYYISCDSTKNGGMYTFSDFNNSDTKKWLEYDPTTFALPADYTTGVAVNFEDVEAVGFIYKTSHQYHKAFQFDFFSLDGIKADPPVVTFDVKGKSGLDLETPIKVTSDVTMKKTDGIQDITNADIPSLFVLKKENAQGEDIAFSGTIDDAAKVITLTPNAALAFNTTYYVALKNEVVCNVLGFSTALTEAIFTTVADTTALAAEIATAQGKYDAAVEGSEEGQYDEGSKDMLAAAIATAQGVIDNAANLMQSDIDLAKEALAKAIGLFDLAQVNSTVTLFYENFGSNQYHTASKANESSELATNREHYLAEPIFIQKNNGGERGWAGASQGSTLTFTFQSNFGGAESGVAFPMEFTIQKINTKDVTNPKLRLASIWNWGPIDASYSTDQGSTWTKLDDTKRVINWEQAGTDWKLYTYSEALPQNEDLWIKIEKRDKTSGMTQIDDITIFADKGGEQPTVTFNIEDNATGIDVMPELKATSEVELFKALDLSIITDATSFFVLKEGDKSGTDVEITASLDGSQKLFTISPKDKLKPNTAYYLALKNRVVADAQGNRVALTERSFTTGCDTISLHEWIATAEALLETAVEGERNGDYIIGSKATLQAAIDLATGIMRDPAATQAGIDAQVTAIQTAISTFQNSIVMVNYDELDKSIKAGNEKTREPNYTTNYTEDSRAAFEEKLTDAKNMRDNMTATQQDVDDAKTALDNALAGLKHVGIEDGTLDALSIYPNPASDFIRVNGVTEVTVNIIGTNGATLIAIDNYNGESIDVSTLASGTYLIKVNDSTFTFIKK